MRKGRTAAASTAAVRPSKRKARESNPHLLAENHGSSVARRTDSRLPPGSRTWARCARTAAPSGGLEPPTFRLTAGGSTFELQGNQTRARQARLARVSGDEGNRTLSRLYARQPRRPRNIRPRQYRVRDSNPCRQSENLASWAS